MGKISRAFRKIAKHKTVSALFAASFLFVFGGWLWAWIALSKTTQPLIFHFNSVAGITQVGTMDDVANVGVLVTVIIFVDFLIALELDDRDRFLGKLLAAGALFLSILIFIGFAAIISVN